MQKWAWQGPVRDLASLGVVAHGKDQGRGKGEDWAQPGVGAVGRSNETHLMLSAAKLLPPILHSFVFLLLPSAGDASQVFALPQHLLRFERWQLAGTMHEKNRRSGMSPPGTMTCTCAHTHNCTSRRGGLRS